MRVATLDLTPEAFLEFCRAGKREFGARRFIVKENPLPDDVKIVRVATSDIMTMRGVAIRLFLESESFADIPDGYIPPALPPVVLETIFDKPE